MAQLTAYDHSILSFVLTDGVHQSILDLEVICFLVSPYASRTMVDIHGSVGFLFDKEDNLEYS